MIKPLIHLGLVEHDLAIIGHLALDSQRPHGFWPESSYVNGQVGRRQWLALLLQARSNFTKHTITKVSTVCPWVRLVLKYDTNRQLAFFHLHFLHCISISHQFQLYPLEIFWPCD